MHCKCIYLDLHTSDANCRRELLNSRLGLLLPVLQVSRLCSSLYFVLLVTEQSKFRMRSFKIRLATGWTVRGSNPGGARFFAHVQTGPGAHPVSCTMDTGSFPGVKRPGRGANHPSPPSAEVENE
jgi:hypothetical protein